MTYQSFQDLRAASPNGAFVVEALSAENGRVPPPPGQTVPEPGCFGFQRMFRYQCRRVDSGNIVWERWQLDSEESPRCLYVSDSGECVVRCKGTLLVLDNLGERIYRMYVRPEFGFSEDLKDVPVYIDDHIYGTTAGFIWAFSSVAYFLETGDQRHFVLRPWWQRRIVIDLRNPRWCDGPEFESAHGPLGGEMLAHEARLAREVLEDAVSRVDFIDPPPRNDDAEDAGEDSPGPIYDFDKGEHETLSRVYAALSISHEQHLDDAAGLVEKLEYCSRDAFTTSSSAFAKSRKSSELYRFMSLRSVAQQLLRQFNQAPAGLPPYVFYRASWTDDKDDEGNETEFETVVRTPQREPAVEQVDLGTDPETVLRTVGAPSHVWTSSQKIGGMYQQDEFWEYDIGVGNEGKTVTLVWSHETPGRLARVESSAPLWLNLKHRSRLFGF